MTFEDRLAELGMSPVPDEPSGLFLVADKEQATPAVRIALEQAERYNADAVLFRLFPEDEKRSPLAQLYIYDRTRLGFSPSEFGEVQRRLWNAGLVPLAAVLTADAVKLFSCRRKPGCDRLGEHFVCRPFDKLEKLVAAERAFLRRAIAGGTLWEDPGLAEEFSFEHSAHKTLLDHLRHFKDVMLKEGGLDPSVAKRLLVLAILLKYLDERTDSEGNGVFPKGFFSDFAGNGCDSLPALFRRVGACVKLFDWLSDRFNGGIFEMSDDERKQLGNADLGSLADFLEGKHQPSGQGVFWRLYSFNDLPVELISNIYEEFLAGDADNATGIVYTPPILVEFLLGQCLPLAPESLGKKILDPACGSGIFLVGAFRRLVQCWRMARDWQSPTHKDLRRILRDSIFGVDVEAEAVLVTAFSLCVALCDELEPKAIWDDLRFDDLRKENLKAEDLFTVVCDKSVGGKFDIVIGNPPFDSTLTTQAARSVEKDAAKHRPKLPDNQLALLFLDQAFKLCCPGGTVCLIQPAGPLLYNVKARDFRNYLLSRHDIQTLFDFTPLESVLFRANVAAAAILARNREPKADELLHVVFRRTRSSKDRLLLEADYYDFHWLGREYVKINPYAWKIDLLGGGRLHRLVERFADMPTLGEFLKGKESAGWVHGEGFIEGCASVINLQPDPSYYLKHSTAALLADCADRRKVSLAPHITGKLTLPHDALSAKGIDSSQLHRLEALFFEWPRTKTKAIFAPPHLLIREAIEDGVIPTAISNEYLTFRDQVIGIHAPPEDSGALELIARWINLDRFGGFWAAVAGAKSLVKRATSYQKSDLMSLPWPDDRSQMALAWWEEMLVSDALDSAVEFRRQGENSAALDKASDDELETFASTYCRSLNAVYAEFRPLKPVRVGDFVCHPFYYGDAPRVELPSAEDAEAVLAKLCRRRHGPRLFVNRIIRLYEQNVIMMIKPNQKRFWLRSVALRDADETVAELVKAGH